MGRVTSRHAMPGQYVYHNYMVLQIATPTQFRVAISVGFHVNVLVNLVLRKVETPPEDSPHLTVAHAGRLARKLVEEWTSPRKGVVLPALHTYKVRMPDAEGDFRRFDAPGLPYLSETLLSSGLARPLNTLGAWDTDALHFAVLRRNQPL